MAPRKKRIILRSGFEEKIVQQLLDLKADFKYESIKIKYQKKPSTYTPDIILSNGIIIEVKGYFDAEDRAKHLLIKEQHPNLDIRFVFQNSRKKIHKASETTYGDWAASKGFLFADKEIPYEWIVERDKKQIREDGEPGLGSSASGDTTKTRTTRRKPTKAKKET